MTVTIGEGRFLRLVREGKWEFVERVNARGAAAIVAVTKNRRIVLIEQFRPAVGCSVVDLPAGLVGDVAGQEQEAIEESARRELLEETGYEAKKLTSVALCPTSPGLTSETVALLLARNPQKIDAGGGVEGENILVHRIPLRRIDDWINARIAEGKMIDTKVYAGLYFALRATRSSQR